MSKPRGANDEPSGYPEKVQHSYHDRANDLEEESPVNDHLAAMSLYRPADQNFPARLHRLLSNAEKQGIAHIISFQPHGRCFRVHKKKEFEEHVLPRWSKLSSMSSFVRQLNLYGFMRLSKGPDKGGYYHELFLRGKPQLCRRIERSRTKGKGGRKAVAHETEPDFYSMQPLPQPDEEGTRFDHASFGSVRQSEPGVPNESASASEPLSILTFSGALLGVTPPGVSEFASLSQIGSPWQRHQALTGSSQGQNVPPILPNNGTEPNIMANSQFAQHGRTTGIQTMPSMLGTQLPPSVAHVDETNPFLVSAVAFAQRSSHVAYAEQRVANVLSGSLYQIPRQQPLGIEAGSLSFAAHATAPSQLPTQQPPTGSVFQTSGFGMSRLANIDAYSDLLEPTPLPELRGQHNLFQSQLPLEQVNRVGGARNSHQVEEVKLNINEEEEQDEIMTIDSGVYE